MRNGGCCGIVTESPQSVLPRFICIDSEQAAPHTCEHWHTGKRPWFGERHQAPLIPREKRVGGGLDRGLTSDRHAGARVVDNGPGVCRSVAARRTHRRREAATEPAGGSASADPVRRNAGGFAVGPCIASWVIRPDHPNWAPASAGVTTLSHVIATIQNPNPTVSP